MKPKTIFKHYDTSITSLLNLKKHILYMASPFKFNDPFDCTIKIGFDEFSDEEVLRIRNKYADLEKDISIKQQLLKQDVETFKKALNVGSDAAIKRLRDQILQSNGICCFTETNTELLMWAHYSESYRGFCLEFNTQFEPFDKMHQVEYVLEFPKIDLSYHVLNDDYNILPKLYCTKSKKWEHEKEWRVIHKNVGTEFCYSRETLKAIYFGPRIDPDLKEIICLILKGQNPNVELWDGQLSDNEFSINFKKFSYISYNEAKKLGLRD
jgi:Protein of unknown function (DUF2971)